MDIIFEIFLEIYGELMMLVIPESKWTKKKGTIALIAVLNFVGVMALFLWGVAFLTENNNTLVYRFIRSCREKNQ